MIWPWIGGTPAAGGSEGVLSGVGHHGTMQRHRPGPPPPQCVGAPPVPRRGAPQRCGAAPRACACASRARQPHGRPPPACVAHEVLLWELKREEVEIAAELHAEVADAAGGDVGSGSSSFADERKTGEKLRQGKRNRGKSG